MKVSTCGYASHGPKDVLVPYKFDTKVMKNSDVHIEIQFCGICHSDIHMARNGWQETIYPMVPGHEIVGTVKDIGSDVKKYKVGDHVGVGCYVESCRNCEYCDRGDENVCASRKLTYSDTLLDGTITQGGYARDIIVEERFVLKLPQNLDMASAAPLLCAGATTFTPMKRWGADKPGTKIGVIGLGGLGHIAVKFGVAWGNEVTVISRTEAKKKEALEELGASGYILSTDPKQMKENSETLDIIVDTVSGPKEMNQYMSLLRVDGRLICLGAPGVEHQMSIMPFSLIPKTRSIVGGLAAGMKGTQEMLDFCGKKNITAIIEKIPMDRVNEAFERVQKSDVRYRFVIDVANTCPKP